MESIKGAVKGQRVAAGASLGVLLVVGSPALLARMADVVRGIEGLRLAGSCTSMQQAIDWLLWDRTPWHFAFVDMDLREGGSEALLQRLLAQPRPGRVVALGAPPASDAGASRLAPGAADLLPAGDVAAFRSYLEARLR